MYASHTVPHMPRSTFIQNQHSQPEPSAVCGIEEEKKAGEGIVEYRRSSAHVRGDERVYMYSTARSQIVTRHPTRVQPAAHATSWGAQRG